MPPVLLIDPELIRTITVRDIEFFTDHQTNFMDNTKRPLTLEGE
jgi:hypothetical protein